MGEPNNATRLTGKQETFCLAYMETGNASEAYRRAYNADDMKPETINRKATELMQNGKITARIASLQTTLTKGKLFALENHLARLDALSRKAEENGNFQAAINAEISRGKCCGFYLESVRLELIRQDNEEKEKEREKQDRDKFYSKLTLEDLYELSAMQKRRKEIYRKYETTAEE